MPAQFLSLPRELRDQIYDLALDRSPRNVEVVVRDGRVLSKTQPPALLHVHRDSREFVLKIYKPWLSQFAGSPAHAPYASLLAKYRPSKTRPVSCLEDVYLDMERDILLCRGSFNAGDNPSPLYLFGRIEESCLRNMAVNIQGDLNFPRVVSMLRNAKNLKGLYFLDASSDTMVSTVNRLVQGLGVSADKDKIKPKVRVPNYVYPTVHALPPSYVPKVGQFGPGHSRWRAQVYKCLVRGSGDRLSTPTAESEFDYEMEFKWEPEFPRVSPWTTYKYPARSSRTPNYPPIKEESHPAEESNLTKRKAETDSDDEAPLSERAKRMKMWTGTPEQRKEILEARSRYYHVEFFDQASMGKEWAGFKPQISQRTGSGEASLSSTPQSDAASSPPQSAAASSRPPSNTGENSETSDNESEDSRSGSPDSQDEEGTSLERTPRQLHAHRFNFDISANELLVEWDDSPETESWEWIPKGELLPLVPIMVASFLSNNPALEAGTPVRFHERNSGTIGFDFLVEFEGYSEEIYWTWIPESRMQARVPDMVDEWMAENASDAGAARAEESIDDQILAEQNYADNVRSVRAEESDIDEPAEQADPGNAGAGDADIKEEDTKDIGEEGSAAEYIPKRFVAQRDTPDGPEILVEWEDWPDEKDWTWEPMKNLQEDAPEMVKAWKATRRRPKIIKVYEVESILGKRKIKGEWHYVVKWKGFAKDEATTLEPCEKITIDVPELVEAFESRKPKRGRPPRKTISA